MDALNWAEKYDMVAAGSPRTRVAHIRYANRVIKERFQLGSPQMKPIAVVGLGPSLADTWKAIEPFENILTTSGAHQFLIKRGIIPTWHMELDTRAHKIRAMGAPHPDVHYLIGSTVHPDLLTHLKGFQVTLFQPLSQNPQIIRELPRGEWCVSAGGSVGNKALVMARMLGFRDIHAFGFDSCLRDGVAHAMAHPNPVRPEHVFPCPVNGRTFMTTKPLLSYAQSAIKTTDRLADATFTFHGDGLLQTMFQQHTPEPSATVFATQKGLLISSEYRDQLIQLHANNPFFGDGGDDENRDRMVSVVQDLKEALKATTVLDYGCGKGALADDLSFPIWEYDPAIPGKDRDARPAELVICTDTLEHVEPACLPAVLQDLKRVTQKLIYLEIRLTPAKKSLPDGQNAHLIQESAAWWVEKLEKWFVVIKAFQIEQPRYTDLYVWAGAVDENLSAVPAGAFPLAYKELAL